MCTGGHLLGATGFAVQTTMYSHFAFLGAVASTCSDNCFCSTFIRECMTRLQAQDARTFEGGVKIA